MGCCQNSQAHANLPEIVSVSRMSSHERDQQQESPSNQQQENQQQLQIQPARRRKQKRKVSKKRSQDHKSAKQKSSGQRSLIQIRNESALARYTYVSKLDEDVNYTIYDAIEKSTNLQRYIKLIHKNKIPSTGTQQIIERAQKYSQLDHPYLIRLLDIMQVDDSLWLVYEKCGGLQLFDKILSLGNFSETRVSKYMWCILRAMEYSHAYGISHGNLVPDNIIFSTNQPDSPFKISGFDDVCLEQFKKQKGLVQSVNIFSGPESLQGQFNQKSDVWSCGVLMFILLSGNPPFSGQNYQQLWEQIMYKPVKFLDPIWNDVSQDAKRIIQNMLEKDPTERPTMTQLLQMDWFNQKEGNSDRHLQRTSLVNLRKFRNYTQFQKQILELIVSNICVEEEIAKLRDLFVSLDKNGDGHLSLDEIEQCRVKANTKQISFKDIIQTLTMNNVETISYTEFIAAATNWTQSLNRSKITKAFQKIDVDGNGKITPDELRIFLGPIDSPQIDKIIQEADMNRDGEIDFEEFTTLILNGINR